MYDGWVKAFSDNSKEAELLLENVSVYKNDTGVHLYDIDARYLSLNRDKISIEVRSTSQEKIMPVPENPRTPTHLPINEGIVKKGGTNRPPSSTRPAPPVGQSSNQSRSAASNHDGSSNSWQ